VYIIGPKQEDLDKSVVFFRCHFFHA
jgi:hypothetical protein